MAAPPVNGQLIGNSCIEQPRGIAFLPNGLLLNWSGLFTRGYRIQRTSSLLPALVNWQTIGAAAGNAGGVQSEFLDPSATGQTTDFYRLAPSL